VQGGNLSSSSPRRIQHSRRQRFTGGKYGENQSASS